MKMYSKEFQTDQLLTAVWNHAFADYPGSAEDFEYCTSYGCLGGWTRVIVRDRDGKGLARYACKDGEMVNVNKPRRPNPDFARKLGLSAEEAQMMTRGI